MVYALRGERASLVEIMRRLAAGELSLDELSKDTTNFDPHAPRRRGDALGQALVRRPTGHRSEMDERCHEHRTPTFRRSDPTMVELVVSLRCKGEVVEVLPFASSAQTVSGCLGAVVLRFPIPRRLGATAILLAAERHRRKAGKWPESIAAIDKSILPNPPADPFSGESFRMEHRNGELLIYSVGPNRKDDMVRTIGRTAGRTTWPPGLGTFRCVRQNCLPSKQRRTDREADPRGCCEHHGSDPGDRM